MATDLHHLITDCTAGNHRAQRALYDLIKGRMMGVCQRYCRDAAEAEDVFQEGMIRLFANLDKVREVENFFGWARRIVVNKAIDNYKKRRSDMLISLEDQETNQFTAEDFSVLDEMSAAEIIALLHELPENQMVVFNMYVVDGYAHKEIATILNIQESSSRTLLTRAKKGMIALLKKTEISESGYGS